MLVPPCSFFDDLESGRTCKCVILTDALHHGDLCDLFSIDQPRACMIVKRQILNMHGDKYLPKRLDVWILNRLLFWSLEYHLE